MSKLNAYYRVRFLIPRRLQIAMRRRLVSHQLKSVNQVWPIDPASATTPEDWNGWPENKKFALVLTHDVDTQRGHDRCKYLMRLEEGLGFRSAFNFVPERYVVSAKLRQNLMQCGFEVGVHGLNHDGRLYESEATFIKRAEQINEYITAWDCSGFRSPAMHHNLDWIHRLNIEYDASTFDTDPFEPQADGMGKIFPFQVTEPATGRHGYVELPYTLAQDFTLFVLMQGRNIDIWKRKLDWLVENGGMALINTHPDYMQFHGQKPGLEEYPAEYYAQFLEYAQEQYAGEFWHALPQDVARFWQQNQISADQSLAA